MENKLTDIQKQMIGRINRKGQTKIVVRYECKGLSKIGKTEFQVPEQENREIRFQERE